ncbi:hypothetical protein FACS189456_1080 [Bacteroidia bacterium]|nr:hypothetical protein FACS189456_1080 [Bacteroidia bacterium]
MLNDKNNANNVKYKTKYLIFNNTVMKQKIFVVLLFICAFSGTIAQESSGSKRLQNLEARRDKLQTRLDKATNILERLDSTKAQSAALKAEGTAEQKVILKEKDAIDKRIKKEVDIAAKKERSSDRETAKEGTARKKEIQAQYRAEVTELKTKFKEAKDKIDKAERMMSGGFSDKYKDAEFELKDAKEQMKSLEKEIKKASK